MGKTKKVKSAGRFGPRYGRGIRKRLLDVEGKQLAPHPCPKCGLARVKRTSRGIFFCRKCGNEFTGGAYFPRTLAGGIIERMVSQKKFEPHLAELESARETAKKADKGLAAEIMEEIEEERKTSGRQPPRPRRSKPQQKAGQAGKETPRQAEPEPKAERESGEKGQPATGELPETEEG